MKDYELLRRGADLIEQRGLARGTLEDKDGGLCFYGALDTAVFGSVQQARKVSLVKEDGYLDAVVAVRKFIKKEPHDWSNNASGAEEVAATMRHVADMLDPQTIEPCVTVQDVEIIREACDAVKPEPVEA